MFVHRFLSAECELERLARHHPKGHLINQKPGLLMGTSNFIVFISFLPDSSLDGSSSGYSLPNWRVNEAIVLRLVVEEYTMFMSEPNGRVLLIWTRQDGDDLDHDLRRRPGPHNS